MCPVGSRRRRRRRRRPNRGATPLTRAPGSGVVLGVPSALRSRTLRAVADLGRSRLSVRGELPLPVDAATAWAAFADLPAWRRWDWMGSADAGWVAGSPWMPGSVLRLGHRPFTFDCTLVIADPPAEVTWQGGGLGIRARHTFRFEPRSWGCLMVSEETFTGRGAGALRPLVRHYWRHHMTAYRRWVAGGSTRRR